MRRSQGKNANPTALAGMIACLTAVAVVLILPTLRTHHFISAYKPVEARQTAARHCYLDLNGERADAEIERTANEPSPNITLPPARPRFFVPVRTLRLVTPLRLSCLLKRLRLGSSRAPDPPAPA